jgi:hypothetical protein
MIIVGLRGAGQLGASQRKRDRLDDRGAGIDADNDVPGGAHNDSELTG